MSNDVSGSHSLPGYSFSIDDPTVASNALDNSTKDSIGHLLNIQARQFTIAQGQQELLSVEEIKDQIKLLTISCRPLIGLSSK